MRISPTAHFTATVWARHGLAHPALAGIARPRLFRWSNPVLARLAAVARSQSVEEALLCQHLGLDARLEAAIAERGVRQVVEVPGGLASRGRRMVERHPGLLYVEGDLPGMAALKRQALRHDPHPRHHVVDVDLLAEGGPGSLSGSVAPLLDPTAPTAFVSEGLLYYLSPVQVSAALGNVSRLLGALPVGGYLADVRLAGQPSVLVSGFLAAVALLTRGGVYAHFDGAAGAREALAAVGLAHDFAAWPAVRGLGAEADDGAATRIHLLEAWTAPREATG